MLSESALQGWSSLCLIIFRFTSGTDMKATEETDRADASIDRVSYLNRREPLPADPAAPTVGGVSHVRSARAWDFFPRFWLSDISKSLLSSAPRLVPLRLSFASSVPSSKWPRRRFVSVRLPVVRCPHPALTSKSQPTREVSTPPSFWRGSSSRATMLSALWYGSRTLGFLLACRFSLTPSHCRPTSGRTRTSKPPSRRPSRSVPPSLSSRT